MGALASIGIPMAISLVSKSFGSGLQVDRQASSNTRNVYVPPPVKARGEGHYPIYPPPFYGKLGKSNRNGVKKILKKGKRSVVRKKQPIQSDSNFRLNFVNKPLSNFDLFDWVKKLGIKYFRDIFT